LGVVGPQPDTDLEHNLAGVALELEDLMHPRLFAVAMGLHPREGLGATERGVSGR
jgi:hypothetical protein